MLQATSMLFLHLLVPATVSTVLSLSFSQQPQRNVLNVGVTSVCAFHISNHEIELFAGTKRGKIHRFLYSSPTSEIQSLGELQDERVKQRFPIFSMTSSCTFDNGMQQHPIQLFCGGGDRFISVWTKEEGVEEKDKWIYSQRLGPHTGWVKDLLYDSTSDTLHSIGCNCIESWKRREDDESQWRHSAKRSIESSIQEGATLSSDLLCLCSASDEADYFFAGGVDGRIHTWSCDLAIKEPISSIGAHDGRVNAILYASSAGILFTAGHDGIIQCRRLSQEGKNKILQRLPDALIHVKDANGDPLRITSLCLLRGRDGDVTLVAGTANGIMACFIAAFENDRRWSLRETTTATTRLRLPDEPMINSICLLNTIEGSESSLSIAVGHSLGLSLLSVAS